MDLRQIAYCMPMFNLIPFFEDATRIVTKYCDKHGYNKESYDFLNRWSPTFSEADQDLALDFKRVKRMLFCGAAVQLLTGIVTIAVLRILYPSLAAIRSASEVRPGLIASLILLASFSLNSSVLTGILFPFGGLEMWTKVGVDKSAIDKRIPQIHAGARKTLDTLFSGKYGLDQFNARLPLFIERDGKSIRIVVKMIESEKEDSAFSVYARIILYPIKDITDPQWSIDINTKILGDPQPLTDTSGNLLEGQKERAEFLQKLLQSGYATLHGKKWRLATYPIAS